MKGDQEKRDADSGRLPPAEAIRLDSLLQYVPGSVVSRTLIKRPVGTVTLFSFDAGQGLSEHTAPFDAYVQVVDGEGEITISGTKFTLQAGQMIIMPANEPHSVKAVKKFKMLLVMIKGKENKK